GAQINRFQQARSPDGHQADPAQLASPAGADEHGAANHVYPPPAESAGVPGGQAETEQGVEPNWQEAIEHVTAPPAAQLPEEMTVVVVATPTVEEPDWSRGEATSTPSHSVSCTLPPTVAGFIVKVALEIPPGLLG